MADPAIDLADYLEDLELGSRTKGDACWWIVVGQQVADDVKQITLLDTGGFAPSYSTTDAVRRSTVQVLVLGEANDYQGTRSCVESIYDAVDGLCDVVMGSTQYMAIEPMQEPVWIGYRESDRRPEWSLNILLME